MSKSFKRIISFILIAAMLITPALASDNTATAAQLSSLVSGQLTLGEFCTSCVYYFELQDQAPAENTFSDLDPDAEHASDILRVVARGGIKGYPDGTVHPDELISKSRAYTILARIMNGLNDADGEYLNLVSNVEAIMCDADSWLAQVSDADTVLMTAEEIETLNAEILAADTGMSDLDNAPETFNGKKLAAALADFDTPSAHYLGKKLVGEKYYNAIRRNISNARVYETQHYRYGFIVNQTTMRSMADVNALTSQLAVPEEDDFALTSLRVNEPVLVYFSTADGTMTYVKCDHCVGWIPTEDLGICESRSQWDKVKNTENFLLVTGQKVYTEPCGDEDWDEKLLTMGTKLPLVEPSLDSVTTRMSYNNYTVLIPARDETGRFYQKTALVASNRDVNVGYLPYTSANVIRLAMDCLGNRYSWGGGVHGFDCSLYLKYVYDCFGFTMPRNTTWQSRIPTAESVDMSSMSVEEKCAALDKVRPGSILFFSGHEMMYLGSWGGKYYVISATGKFVDPQNKEAGTQLVYGIVINDLSITRANGKTWLESLNRATVIE